MDDPQFKGLVELDWGSACDVVATAGKFSYKTVERAWTNRDPILS